VGTGIGGGVIANGKLVRGANDLAGEIGHVTIDPSGPVCTCGRRGCLEAYASGPSIERRFSERIEAQDRRKTGREIFALAASGDPVALTIVNDTADVLARGIGAAVNLLNPERVILGGGLSETGDLLFQPLNRALSRYVLLQLSRVQLVPALLGYDAGVRGAVALAMERHGVK
jgi:glucokinase